MDEGSKGSALVVVAIVLLIAGLAGIGLLYSVQSVTRETQEEQTAVKLRHVIRAFSVYYQRYSRVPCPANPNSTDVNPPFGTERGSGADGTAVGDCPLIPDEDGIVPFKTLGMAEDDAKDAWGRYFTYHVNQSSSWSAAEAGQYIAAYPNVKVSDLCRVKNIWVAPGGLDDNYYPKQALACCIDPAAGIRIVNGSGADVTGLPSVSTDRFAPQKDPAPSSISLPYTLRNPPAIVLISHGRNGMGAYLGTGTHSRSPIGGTSAGEIANASGDTGNTVFVKMPRTEAPSSYFDDIVMFETLSSLYAEAGGNSGGDCSFYPGCPAVPVVGNRHNLDLYGNHCP